MIHRWRSPGSRPPQHPRHPCRRLADGGRAGSLSWSGSGRDQRHPAGPRSRCCRQDPGRDRRRRRKPDAGSSESSRPNSHEICPRRTAELRQEHDLQLGRGISFGDRELPRLVRDLRHQPRADPRPRSRGGGPSGDLLADLVAEEDAGKAETYLLEESYDLIINVVDASRLGTSLELTTAAARARKADDRCPQHDGRGDARRHGGRRRGAVAAARCAGGADGRPAGSGSEGPLPGRSATRPHRARMRSPSPSTARSRRRSKQVVELLEENGSRAHRCPDGSPRQKLLERDPHFERVIYASPSRVEDQGEGRRDGPAEGPRLECRSGDLGEPARGCPLHRGGGGDPYAGRSSAGGSGRIGFS